MLSSVEDSDLILRIEIPMCGMFVWILLIVVNSLKNKGYCVRFLHQLKCPLPQYNSWIYLNNTVLWKTEFRYLGVRTYIYIVKHCHIRQNAIITLPITCFALDINAKISIPQTHFLISVSGFSSFVTSRRKILSFTVPQSEMSRIVKFEISYSHTESDPYPLLCQW